jgi:hypothetical protein
MFYENCPGDDFAVENALLFREPKEEDEASGKKSKHTFLWILLLLLLIFLLFGSLWGQSKEPANANVKLFPLTSSDYITLGRALDDIRTTQKLTPELQKVLSRSSLGFWARPQANGVYILPANPQVGIPHSWKVFFNPEERQWEIEDPSYSYQSSRSSRDWHSYH